MSVFWGGKLRLINNIFFGLRQTFISSKMFSCKLQITMCVIDEVDRYLRYIFVTFSNNSVKCLGQFHSSSPSLSIKNIWRDLMPFVFVVWIITHNTKRKFSSQKTPSKLFICQSNVHARSGALQVCINSPNHSNRFSQVILNQNNSFCAKTSLNVEEFVFWVLCLHSVTKCKKFLSLFFEKDVVCNSMINDYWSH